MNETELQHYQKVIQEIKEPAVLVQNPGGQVVYCNDIFNRHFKRKRASLIGDSLDRIVGIDMMSKLLQKDQTNFTFQYPSTNESKSKRTFIVSCIWIENNDLGIITLFDLGNTTSSDLHIGKANRDLPMIENLDGIASKISAIDFDNAENILKIQYEILDAVKNISSTEKIMIEILEAICRLNKINGGAIYSLASYNDMRLVASWKERPADVSFPDKISNESLPENFTEGQVHSKIFKFNNLKTTSHLLPLYSNDRLIGSIMFRTDCSLDAKLSFEALNVFTSWIGSFLDHHNAKRQLNETMQNYKLLMENMNEGLVIIDQDERFSMVNRKLCDMTGFSEDDFIGSKIWDFFEPLQSSKVKRVRQERPDRGDKKYELAIVKKNGDRMWLTISPTTLRDVHGNPTGVLAIVTDITNYVHLFDDINFKHGGISDILMHLTNLSIVCYNFIEKKIEFANHHCVQHYGFTYDEIYSMQEQDLIEIVHPDDRSLLRNYLFEAQGSKAPIISNTIAYRLKSKFDKYIWVSSNIIVQINEEGVPVRVFLSTFDISEYRYCTEKLDEQYGFNRLLFKKNPTPMLIVKDPVTALKIRNYLNGIITGMDVVFEPDDYVVQNSMSRMLILEANKACLDLFEVEHCDEIAAELTQFVTIEMISGIRKGLIAFLQGKEDQWFPASGITKTGRKIDLEVLITPLEMYEDSLLIAFK